MIPKLRPSSAKRRPLIFAPIVNWITFTRGLLGQGGVHRMARADFNVRAGKVAWRYTAPAALFFWVRFNGDGVVQHRPDREDVGWLSESITVATRFGQLLDFPEHPHKGNAEADDDAQKQQRQSGGCEHGGHP
jgi:hypothetical protein